MFYDPQCKPETKIETKVDDPLSLPALTAWLEKLPAGVSYEYFCAGTCLAGQYNASIGRKYGGYPIAAEDVHKRLSEISFDAALELVAIARPHTYGAALNRIRAGRAF